MIFTWRVRAYGFPTGRPSTGGREQARAPAWDHEDWREETDGVGLYAKVEVEPERVPEQRETGDREERKDKRTQVRDQREDGEAFNWFLSAAGLADAGRVRV